MAYRLKQEGHSVRLCVEDKNQKQNLDGMVEKTKDWKKELNWVGKNGLIVFDSIGYGKAQDDLRKEGYSVVGGNQKADQVEDNRQEGHKILSLCEMKPIPSFNFSSAKDAIKFLERNKGCWVVKQNGHIYKGFNYIGQFEDGSDVIDILKSYARNNKKECSSIDLQKRVEGIELGVARYFNGNDWVGPIEINMEHKNLCNDNLGPKTDEMGTLMWYDDNENNKLFQKTLAKLKPYLQSINFKGDFDIDFIINEDKLYPLEVTARFGWPAVQLQSEIHDSPWGEFLKAVADGKPYDLKFKKGYGVVVFIATPPFPYPMKLRKYYPEGQKIFFKKDFSEKDLKHVHFEEVSIKQSKEKKKEYYISSKTGHILTITGMGKTVKEARERTYRVIDKIVIPKMFYRTDIGLKFIQEEQKMLKKWGWI